MEATSSDAEATSRQPLKGGREPTRSMGIWSNLMSRVENVPSGAAIIITN